MADVKKRRGLLIALGAVLLAAAIFWALDSFFGNPVSALLARNAAEKYLAENYAGGGYAIDDTVYDFKFDAYAVKVSSDKGADRHFEIYAGKLGNVLSDSYDDVSGGWNTYDRVNGEYSRRAEELLSPDAFPYERDYAFGSLITSDETARGLRVASLVPDADYDVNELAAKYGRLIVYVRDGDVSAEKAAEILLELKTLFDGASLPFYDVDLSLDAPLTDEEAKYDENRVELFGFPYEEIYPEGLAGRIRRAAE